MQYFKIRETNIIILDFNVLENNIILLYFNIREFI